MRSPRLLFALLAVVIAGLAVPAVAQANLTVLKDQEDADPVELVTFKTAKCKKTSKKKADIKFSAVAKKSGYKLTVKVAELGREFDIQYAVGDVAFSLRGPGGPWSSVFKPPTGVPAGALRFNSSKKTRMALGFSPAFNESLTSTVSLGGAVTCKYKKKKRRRRR
jgi:hypothetical protein